MRSKLFVPGSRPELFPKALASQADSVAFDLEDSVAEAAKPEARRLVSQALQSPECAASKKILMVRVNGLTTAQFTADLSAVVGPRLDLLNLPKVESPDDIRAVAGALARLERERGLTAPIGILANVESPRGL